MKARHEILAATAVIAAGVLAGCTVGPDYKRPATTMPAAFASTQPSAAADLLRWWDRLGDPLLSSLVTRASAANLDLRIARSRVREARASRGIVAGSGQPQVNAGAGYSRSLASENIGDPRFGGSSQSDLFTAGFDASWELDVFGGQKRAVESADAQVQASVEAQRDTLISVQAETARNYLELRTAQMRLDVAQNSLRVQRDSLELARARYNAGVASELDVQRSEAQVAATEAQVPLIQSVIQASIYRLSVLLGRSPGELQEELTPVKPIPVAPLEIPAGQPGDLLQRRPDIRRAERELAAATAQIGVARSDLYPKFSLVGDLGLQSSRFTNWWEADSQYWSIGPRVSWSILNGGRVRANIAVRNAQQEQALLRYQQTILLGVEEAENALTRYAQEQRRRAALQRAVDASRNALGLARTLYERGLTDMSAVLDTERALYTNEEQLAISEGNVAGYAIAVYKALGGGWQQPELARK